MKDTRKELGQFFTDPQIAGFMARLCVDQGTKELLDPAVGRGALIRPVHEAYPQVHITACEIDPGMREVFQRENQYPYVLKETDYLKATFDREFDCIICNPPYLKFQAIPERKELIREFRERYGISLNGFSNICVYFLVKSMSELRRGGRCCYIMPYEFLNTGYGAVIKQYLLDSKMLKQVLRFDPRLHLFEEVTTTSCILLLENEEHVAAEFINVTDLKELSTGEFYQKKAFAYEELDAREKWLRYFEEAGERNRLCECLVPLSVFGKVNRGIATGSNDYFVLNASALASLRIRREVCIPCLAKAPDVSDLVFTKDSFQKLVQEDKKVFLFDGKRAETKEERAYIALGEARGIHRGYLTSHRDPWYAIEKKEAAPILISTFHRDRIKVIRNEAGVKSLTAFHGLCLWDPDKEWADLVFCYLLTPLAQELLFLARREYGGGLQKFEPGDLNHAKVLDLRLIREGDRGRILELYDVMKRENKLYMLEELDRIFRGYLTDGL